MSANSNHCICCSGEASTIEKTKWTTKMVEEYFLEVIITLKKLPSVEQRGYFIRWPDIIYSPNEIIFQKKKSMRVLATPEAISRIDKIFDWMIWLKPEERKLIWRRAANIRWNSICREFGYNRITAWRKWNIALGKIVKKLNNS